MKEQHVRLSFAASGYINQDIIINDGVNAEEVIAMLNSGQAITSTHEGNDVIIVEGIGKVIGTVYSVEPELDYRMFKMDEDGTYELVTKDTPPLDITQLALKGAIGEFIYEEDMTVSEIMSRLEAAGHSTPEDLTLERGYRSYSGKDLLFEINAMANGLRAMMEVAYNAGKSGQEIV